MQNSAIVNRNRKNAQASTGPITPAGKSRSRSNALRHGLTANPATGVAESPIVFERLLQTLYKDFQPRSMIEQALVHKIANCIWRQQRAARIEAAVTAQAVDAVVPARAEVQSWVASIHGKWNIESREEPETDQMRVCHGIKTKLILFRPHLEWLDLSRHQDIMKCGAAITAMMVMIESLMDLLVRVPDSFHRDRCEQLSWPLGDGPWFPASIDADFPDAYPNCTEIQRLIGEARKRPVAAPVPPKLVRMVKSRLEVLHDQSMACEEPYFSQTWEHRQAAAMLPKARLLDKMIRYEVHADRSLYRALEQLAKMRGATVERLAASLTGTAPDGTTVQLTGERTVWHPPADGAG